MLPLAILSASVLALSGQPAAAATETVAVGTKVIAPAVSKGFLGFSVEYGSIADEAGPASDPDPLLDDLIQTLNPGQQPVIRIGGDSTDHTWYPVSGADRPGFTFSLTPAWISSVATFARATHARLILGINLEMNDPGLARVEADQLDRGLGASHILAWEVGNEPDLYLTFPWYVTTPNDPDTGVFVRPRNYDFAQYLQQYTATAKRLPDLPLAGPAVGDPAWTGDLPALLKADPTLTQVTYHAYPTNCYATEGTSDFPSIPNLLSRTASDGLAQAVAPFAEASRRAGRSFRVDELNSTACGGTPGVSDTFASALWVTDTLFALASQGVTGVNIQDFQRSVYKPFGFSQQADGSWSATVYPLYYGLLLFARAAPAGSQLVSVTTTGTQAVSAWAARAGGQETVTLINHATARSQTVSVSAPGTSSGTITQMLAPGGASATAGVTLGGQSYGASTTTGQPTGTSTVAPITPTAGHTYSVTLSPASAVLLTLKR